MVFSDISSLLKLISQNFPCKGKKNPHLQLPLQFLFDFSRTEESSSVPIKRGRKESSSAVHLEESSLSDGQI